MLVMAIALLPEVVARRSWLSGLGLGALLMHLPALALPELKGVWRLARRGPSDIYLLADAEAGQQVEAHISDYCVGVFHWRDGKLHRDGDRPAFEAFDAATGALVMKLYAQNGCEHREGGRPTGYLRNAKNELEPHFGEGRRFSVKPAIRDDAELSKVFVRR